MLDRLWYYEIILFLTDIIRCKWTIFKCVNEANNVLKGQNILAKGWKNTFHKVIMAETLLVWLQALCEGNRVVTAHTWTLMRRFDIFFVVIPNKLLKKRWLSKFKHMWVNLQQICDMWCELKLWAQHLLLKSRLPIVSSFVDGFF